MARVKRIQWAVATIVALALTYAPASWALGVGKSVKNVKVRDANDKPAWLPDFGKKVLTIFYTDPDVKEQNERFREILKKAKLPDASYRGFGVVNLKDTWKPNFIIRRIIRGKIKKFGATILTDPGRLLPKAWKLGDCNERDLVIVIGRDKKVKYLKRSKMSGAEHKSTLALIKGLITQGGSER